MFGSWRNALAALCVSGKGGNWLANGSAVRGNGDGDVLRGSVAGRWLARMGVCFERRVALMDKNAVGCVHDTGQQVGWRLRYLVLKRDNFRCLACGASPATQPGTELHVDHVVPYSRGGETVAENLQTLCAVCNGGKSNLTI